MRNAIKIEVNQVWKNKTHDNQIMVVGKKGQKFKCVVLTDRTGVYNGTHTITQFIINRKYDLIG